MKCIFLDIDGVLNSLAWYQTRPEVKKFRSFFDREVEDLDPKPIKMLKEFVEKNDLKIVISSTWRLLHSEQELVDIFKVFDWDIPIIGMTPDSRKGFRGDEIQEFLDNNKIDSYLILDDDSDFHCNQLSRFVRTKHNNGLTPERLELAQAILDGTREECPECDQPLNFGEEGIWCSQTQFKWIDIDDSTGYFIPDDRGTCKYYIRKLQ